MLVVLTIAPHSPGEPAAHHALIYPIEFSRVCTPQSAIKLSPMSESSRSIVTLTLDIRRSRFQKDARAFQSNVANVERFDGGDLPESALVQQRAGQSLRSIAGSRRSAMNDTLPARKKTNERAASNDPFAATVTVGPRLYRSPWHRRLVEIGDRLCGICELFERVRTRDTFGG